MTILHFLTHRTPIPLWPLPLRHPGLSCLVGVRNDPAGLQHVFFLRGGGGGGGCSCQFFQELYPETRHGNVSLILFVYNKVIECF